MNTKNPYESPAVESPHFRPVEPSVVEIIFDWATPALFAIQAVLSLLVFTSSFWLAFLATYAQSFMTDRLLILTAFSPLFLAVAFIAWTFVSHRNLRQKFNFQSLVFGSSAALYSYIIPILGFFLPYGFVNEIYKGYRLRSEGRDGEIVGDERVYDIKASPFVLPWWIGFILLGALYWVALVVANGEGAEPGAESVFYLDLATEVLRLVAAGFGFAMVLQINRLKNEAYRRAAQ